MHTVLFILFIGCATLATVLSKKLTAIAGLTGAALASLIFIGVGWIGIALMSTFFLLGTQATSWKKKFKQSLGLVQEKGRRNTGQVLANGGGAGVLGLLAICFPEYNELLVLMMAAAFSSATADTVSSELGSVYGSSFYDILSFKTGQRGLDGVISIEGLLFGIAGSVLVAAVYALVEATTQYIPSIILAGTIGNLTDSYLGATLERQRKIGNDAVNFLNTAIAILAMWALY